MPESLSEIILQYEFVPPSVNSCYRSTGSRVYKSKTLKVFEKQMNEYFADHVVDKLEGRLKLEVTFFFKGKRKRDLDNVLKALLDSLEGRLFDNDNQIFEILAKKEFDCAINEMKIILSSLD